MPAGSAVITLGDFQLPYSDFCAAIAFFIGKGYTFYRGCRDLLKDLIMATKLSRMYRDNIALLGLVTRGHEFPVDYSQSLRKLFVETVWYLITNEPETGLSDILRFLAEVERDPRTDFGDCPSWIPRWHIPRKSPCRINDMLFGAGGGCNVAPAWPLGDKEVLQVHGSVIDKITISVDVGDLDITSNPEHFQEQLRTLLKSIRQFTLALDNGYATGEDWYDVFAQVLTAGFRENMADGEKRFSSVDGQWLFLVLFVNKWRNSTHRSETEELLEEFKHGYLNMSQFAHGYSPGPSFLSTITNLTTGRKLFRTHEGLIGLGSRILKPGDSVCVIFGSGVPYILRPAGDQFLS